MKKDVLDEMIISVKLIHYKMKEHALTKVARTIVNF